MEQLQSYKNPSTINHKQPQNHYWTNEPANIYTKQKFNFKCNSEKQKERKKKRKTKIWQETGSVIDIGYQRCRQVIIFIIIMIIMITFRQSKNYFRLHFMCCVHNFNKNNYAGDYDDDDDDDDDNCISICIWRPWQKGGNFVLNIMFFCYKVILLNVSAIVDNKVKITFNLASQPTNQRLSFAKHQFNSMQFKEFF